MEEYCICSVYLETQFLKETNSSGITLGEISDQHIQTELKIVQNNNSKEPCQARIKAWSSGSCDPIPVVKNAADSLRTFLSNCFSKDRFYFIFAEGKSAKNEQIRNEKTKYSAPSPEPECENNAKSKKRENKESISSNENSVFGSPLKLETIADFSLNDSTSDFMSTSNISDQCLPQLRGLPIQEARKFLSRFCQVKKIEQKESILYNMVILCDGMDPNKTVLVGAYHVVGENKKLTTFRVTSGNKKVSLSFLEPLDLPDGDVCHMSSSFELLERKDGCKRLRLEADWTDSRGNSIISNLHAARFALHVALPFGYRESPLSGYYSLLKHVMMLCRGLKDGELPSVLSDKPYNALESLQDLFMRITNGTFEDTSPVCGKGKKVNLRPDKSSDVTDQLWEIFSQCETYQDLVMCLKTTFNILKANKFPLFVRHDNETMLARLVQQSSKGLIYFPPLTSLMPLKIVAEIGLEKMKKIYTSILLENEFCSSNSIDRFFKACLKEDIDLSVSTLEQDHHINEMLLETIKKLHHCIDILCMIDLHSEHTDLKDAASHVLNHYSGNDMVDGHTFIIPLDARQASKEVVKLSPTSIRREYKIKGHTYVDCFLSELPEGLAIPLEIHSHAGGDNISLNFGESKDCFKFKTEENVIILGH